MSSNANRFALPPPPATADTHVPMRRGVDLCTEYNEVINAYDRVEAALTAFKRAHPDINIHIICKPAEGTNQAADDRLPRFPEDFTTYDLVQGLNLFAAILREQLSLEPQLGGHEQAFLFPKIFSGAQFWDCARVWDPFGRMLLSTDKQLLERIRLDYFKKEVWRTGETHVQYVQRMVAAMKAANANKGAAQVGGAAPQQQQQQQWMNDGNLLSPPA